MKTLITSNTVTPKQLFFLMLCFLFIGSIEAQSLTASAQGVLDFETVEIDYGTIKKNSDGERMFTFKNTGNAPIVITNVKTTCGCTVPTKPKGPVMPGQMAQIGVKYATNRVGAFSKTVTVISNASETRMVLKIKGTVVDAENKLGE